VATKVSARVKALVVDDQPIVASGVARCLVDNGFEICGIIADVRALPTQVDILRPGLIVLDPAAHNRARALAIVDDVVSTYATPVLAFTVDLSLLGVQSALENGCLGIVPRVATVEAFVAGAHAVASGERHLHQRALAVLLQGIQSAEVGHDVRELSGRELGVLELIAEGCTNAGIGERLGITHGTVKTHVENLLRKLDATDRAHAVSRAMRLGMLR
jgi:DNA-binding NarL/FixJ family response regulator